MDTSEEYCIFNLMIPLPEASMKIGTFSLSFHNNYVPFKSAHKRMHLPWMTVELEYLIRKSNVCTTG